MAAHLYERISGNLVPEAARTAGDHDADLASAIDAHLSRCKGIEDLVHNPNLCVVIAASWVLSCGSPRFWLVCLPWPGRQEHAPTPLQCSLSSTPRTPLEGSSPLLPRAGGSSGSHLETRPQRGCDRRATEQAAPSRAARRPQTNSYAGDALRS